jgi:hypothetical protein
MKTAALWMCVLSLVVRGGCSNECPVLPSSFKLTITSFRNQTCQWTTQVRKQRHDIEILGIEGA